MRRMLAISSVALGLALALGACGGSSKSTSSTQPSTPTEKLQPTVPPGHVAKPVAATPSDSAKMVCATTAQKDIAEVLGVKPTKVTTPTWVDDVYSCDYVYPNNAKMTISVKELSNTDDTTAYYDKLAQQLGRKTNLQGLGQGSFTTQNGSVVTRKDYKVLLVDPTHLPAQFGVPVDTREDNAINVSFTIMGCWTGA